MASSSHSAERSAQPPGLLYIMGTGRSGSTVLEIVLAAAPQTHGGGELFDVIDDGLRRNVACSCGQPFSACPIWRPVGEALHPMVQSPDEAVAASRRLEWHRGFWRQWLAPRPLPETYARSQRTILDALRKASGARTVVDSSKYAGRALALHSLLGKELKVVWLLRSPAGILQSFRKQNPDEQRPKSLLSAVLYVAYVTLCCRLAQIRLRDQCLVVHYEDFMADPQQELQRIGNWSGMDFADVQRRIAADEGLLVGHLLTANRLRKNRLIRLRFDPVVPDTYSHAQHVSAALLRQWYKLLRIENGVSARGRGGSPPSSCL